MKLNEIADFGKFLQRLGKEHYDLYVLSQELI
jgi:hypothetical protein